MKFCFDVFFEDFGGRFMKDDVFKICDVVFVFR